MSLLNIMSQEKLAVFISWSGTLAGAFAEAFKSTIKDLIGLYAEPFFSKDIPPGESFHREILNKLQETTYGIVIITPDSIRSSWVHYEAGMIATAAHNDKQKSWLPLLVGIDREDSAFKRSPIKYHQYREFNSHNPTLTVNYLEEVIQRILTISGVSYDREWIGKITESGTKLHEILKIKFLEWENGFKTHLPDLELVNYSDQNPGQFRNFIGQYIAFNAPLIYEEAGNNEQALEEHVERYSNGGTNSEYFYPIFSLLSTETLSQWLYNINGFFERLLDKLDDEEKMLLKFYAPDFDSETKEFQIKFGYDMGFTFFFGEKNDDSKLVYIYMHNRIYTDLSDTKEPVVKKYFIVRRSEDYELHKSFIRDKCRLRSMKGMKKMNLDQFIEYCKNILSCLEN